MFIVNLINGSTHRLRTEQFEDLKECIAQNKSFFVYEKGLKALKIAHISEWGVEGDILASEDQKLTLKGFYRCRYGKLHKFDEKCECKSQGVELPADIKRRLAEMAGQKEMPKTSYLDDLKSRADGGEARAKQLFTKKTI